MPDTEKRMKRRLFVPTNDVPCLGDYRWLVEHADELGVPESVDIRPIRGALGGPFGDSEPGFILTWSEDVP